MYKPTALDLILFLFQIVSATTILCGNIIQSLCDNISIWPLIIVWANTEVVFIYYIARALKVKNDAKD